MPAQAPEREARDTAINLRAPRSWRELVDRAADVAGKSRTEFILESTRARAVDVLLDQRLFALEPRRYEAFMAVLDASPKPNEKLRQLLKRKAPWDR
jgi:uncharacterized protein (DUF1778 family)